MLQFLFAEFDTILSIKTIINNNGKITRIPEVENLEIPKFTSLIIESTSLFRKSIFTRISNSHTNKTAYTFNQLVLTIFYLNSIYTWPIS